MHIYTSSFFKFRNKANFYSFLGASAGTGAPRNTQKIGTQCGCEYGYKNYESFGSLKKILTIGWTFFMTHSVKNRLPIYNIPYLNSYFLSTKVLFLSRFWLAEKIGLLVLFEAVQACCYIEVKSPPQT